MTIRVSSRSQHPHSRLRERLNDLAGRVINLPTITSKDDGWIA